MNLTQEKLRLWKRIIFAILPGLVVAGLFEERKGTCTFYS